MANATIDAIRQAEKNAIAAAKAANEKAQHSFKVAQKEALDIVSKAKEKKDSMVLDSRNNAQKEADAYIDAEVKKAKIDMDKLKNDAKEKEEAAIAAILTELTSA